MFAQLSFVNNTYLDRCGNSVWPSLILCDMIGQILLSLDTCIVNDVITLYDQTM